MGCTRWSLVVAVTLGLFAAAGCGGSDDSGAANLKFYSPLDPGGTNVKAAKECSAASDGQVHDRARPAGQQRRRVARAARPAPGRRGLRHRPDQHGHDLDAGVRRGGLAARARRAPRRPTRSTTCSRARRTPWSGRARRLRRAAEHERAAALVPQGPRPEPARDVGRDDRDGQGAPGPRGPHPGAGQPLRGLRRVVQQPRRLGRRQRSSTRRAIRRSTRRPSRRRRSSGTSRPPAARTRRCPPTRRTRRASPSRRAGAPSCSTGRSSTPPPGPPRRPAR